LTLLEPPLLDEIIIAQMERDCKEKEESHKKAQLNLCTKYNSAQIKKWLSHDSAIRGD
jgi:hypothetical protein